MGPVCQPQLAGEPFELAPLRAVADQEQANVREPVPDPCCRTEEQVLPRAAERGATVLTFNNTCYGRLLTGHDNLPAPSAADCYRYSLAQPGVTACLTAPATLEELDENLAALRDPDLPAERRAVLLARGERVYQDDTVFRRCVRSR